MWLLIIIIIAIVVAVFVKKYADKAKQEQIEKAKIEKQRKREAEARANKAKYEVLTETEKQQLVKLGGDELLNVTLDIFNKAIRGNTDAMVFMGITYQAKLKNPRKTIYWLQKAADAGNSDGLYWCGECYVSGYGVQENRTKGVSMIIQAASKGSKQAIQSLKENGMTVAEMRSCGIPV